jgi:N-acetylmuramoyl-L-alanine amidase
MLLAVLGCASANASEIKQLRIETSATGTRAVLQLDKPGPYQLIRLSNPERLAVDFPESHLARAMALPAATGIVKAVRTGQPVPGTVRVVFDLSNKVAAIPTLLETTSTGTQLQLEWPGDGELAKPAVAAVVSPPHASKPAVTPVAVPPATAAANTATTTAPTTAPAKPVGASPIVAPTADPIAELARQAAASLPAARTPEPVLPVPPALAQPSALPKLPMQKGLRPLIVAIDAGHGGQDPGAHGMNGAREKDVTLAIARELARQVNATPGLKAYLTRDTDVFIPLEYRARRASANKADIFLSIHADAAENRSARGSSVYVLSTRGASSQRARWLADKENAADVIGGTRVRGSDNTLTSVLLDLTQSGNMKASEDAADHVLGGLKRVGNNHKPDIERANFAVLRTSDKMPAMLVETAFISNPDEEKRLTDPAYQRTLAGAIVDGIDTYFSRQPPPGTLYAARAQAGQPVQAEAASRSGIGGSR